MSAAPAQQPGHRRAHHQRHCPGGRDADGGHLGIADEDGLDVTFSYQWLADDTATQGATGSTYTLADADEGKAIKVQVSFTDDAGHDETLTSEATEAVAAAPQPNRSGRRSRTDHQRERPRVGETLTAGTPPAFRFEVGWTQRTPDSYQWTFGVDREIRTPTISGRDGVQHLHPG